MPVAESLSARRAWIEIHRVGGGCLQKLVALRKESVDRNLRPDAADIGLVKSLSARRAWIEIFQRAIDNSAAIVALRKESVDRNGYLKLLAMHILVALRKESVDRNCPGTSITLSIIVSLSARRAWIEIAPRW